MNPARKFEDLAVWKKSHGLVIEVYKLTKNFPDDERFGLISQMRRASVSVAANIVEGFKRRGARDKINFYNISQSSLSELRYYLILSEDLKYSPKLETLEFLCEEISKMLHGLIVSIESNHSD